MLPMFSRSYEVYTVLRSCLALCALYLFASAPAAAQNAAVDTAMPDFSEQRLAFWEAGKALDAGDLQRYRNLLDRLEDYPLAGYLRYDYLRTRLDETPDAEIEQFLTDFADSPLSNRLRAAWLYALARERRWDTYLKVYQPYPGEQGAALQCYALQARLSDSGAAPDDWLDEVEKLWLVGRSQPDECNAAFKAWRNSGRMTEELIWQRIRLAMDNRQLSLAGQLAKSLDAQGQQWVTRWQRMHNDPETTLQTDFPDGERAREIIRYGIKRLARSDASSAAQAWQRLKSRHAFSAEDIAATDKELAMAAALQHQPEALDWLAAVDTGQVDERVRQWRVRTAVAKQDWQNTLKWLDALEPAEREKDVWRYWRARALEQSAPAEPPAQSSNPRAEAERIFSELSAQRGYYGFLAADRIDKPYTIKNQPIEADAEEVNALKIRPGIVRAYELYQMGLIADARREWDYTVAALDARGQQLAAYLANRWGWHDRAILTVAKANHMDDLELRFPLLFRDQVLTNAQSQELDPAWVYGVMRQESAFITDARSSAGALGLMQLMPETGKRTAQLLNTPLRSVNELLNVDKNIRLGSAYLRRVLDANNGDQVLATASYNAGPARVRQWLPSDGALPADVWVDNVPFGETRNYIQQVMAYTVIFRQRLGLDITPLHQRMQDIGPPPEEP